MGEWDGGFVAWAIGRAEKGLYLTYRPSVPGHRHFQRSLGSLTWTELRALRWRVDEELRRRRRRLREMAS